MNVITTDRVRLYAVTLRPARTPFGRGNANLLPFYRRGRRCRGDPSTEGRSFVAPAVANEACKSINGYVFKR